MLCANCGKEIVSDAAFCPYCGKPVERAVEEPEKALTRPRTGRVIGGVAAGMSRYFGLPPTTLRIGWAVLAAITLGLVAILYIVLWFAVPEE
jgi:phage shock protein C